MSRDEIFKGLRRYVTEEILGGEDEDLDGSTRLLETGLVDSMTMIGLIAHVEHTYGVQIADSQVNQLNFGTLDALTELVSSLRSNKAG